MEFLRDPIWQFFGAVIAFAGIFVSYLIFKRQHSQKQITYEIITNTPLLSLAGELKSKLEVYYEGKPTQSITLLIIKITNSGNTPILPSEFERPIKLSVGDDVEILESDIFKVVPENIQPEITNNVNSVELKPLLLNSGDQIFIKMLIKEFDSDPTVDGRIAGINRIVRKSKNPISTTSLLIDLLFIFIGTFIFTAITAFGYYRMTEYGDAPGTVSILFGLFGLSVLAYGVFDTYRDIRKVLRRGAA